LANQIASEAQGALIRYHSTSEFTEIVLSCRCAFSKRSWPYLLAMAVPWLLVSGQRHVRRLCARAAWQRDESGFYRFLSRFKFRQELFFKALLDLIIANFGLQELLIVVDDTLCPKWGKRIFGAGNFFDHVRRPRPGYIWGHNWVVLAAIVRLFGVPVAVPFWVVLYRSQSTCPKEVFRTRLQLVAQALQTICGWVSLPIQLVADGAYNNTSLLKPLAELGIPLVSRLRLDARLRRDPPKRRRKRRGRKPKYGAWLAKLRDLARAASGWERIRADIYGKSVTLHVKSFKAWWPKANAKLHVVLVRDPSGKRPPCYLSSTDLSLTPRAIIERFALRWTIEQMFSDAKLLLGLDSAEVRAEHSVVRHASITFALLAWVRVWAAQRLATLRDPPTSFAAQLTELRGTLMAHTIFMSNLGRKLSPRNVDSLARLAVAS
jgi:hypothetical protein